MKELDLSQYSLEEIRSALEKEAQKKDGKISSFLLLSSEDVDECISYAIKFSSTFPPKEFLLPSHMENIKMEGRRISQELLNRAGDTVLNELEVKITHGESFQEAIEYGEEEMERVRKIF